MFVAPFRVILDANVLYPFSLRDTLLRAAACGLFQAHWSGEILDEVRRNLIANQAMPAANAERLLAQMTAAFPEALVEGYEPFVAAMKNDKKDRHVAAAALKAGAQVIVTSNLKDFRVLPPGIEARTPDDFLSDLLDLDPQRLVELVATRRRCSRSRRVRSTSWSTGSPSSSPTLPPPCERTPRGARRHRPPPRNRSEVRAPLGPPPAANRNYASCVRPRACAGPASR